MKKRSFFSLFILILTCSLFFLTASAETTYYEARIRGDYIQAISTYGVTGDVMGNEYQHMISRFKTFSQEYHCNVYLWMWKTLDKSGYGSFDLAKDDLEKQATPDSVYILYMDDIKKAYVHTGDQVIPDYDTSQLTQILCEDANEEAFDKLVHVFDALCSTANTITGQYVTYLNIACGDVDEKAVRDAAAPVHEVFPGYVCIDYYGDDIGIEDSMLRISRTINYDEVYARWEHPLDYYFRDTVYITYFAKTGTALVDIGEETGIHISKKTLREIESAFSPSYPDDLSGFQKGIAELADHISQSDSSLSFGVSGIWITAAAAGLLIVLLYVLQRTGRIFAKNKRNE